MGSLSRASKQPVDELVTSAVWPNIDQAFAVIMSGFSKQPVGGFVTTSTMLTQID